MPEQCHRIRLRGPWQIAGSPAAEATTAQLPAAWQSLFGDEGGRVRFARRFNRPTNLEERNRVELVFAGIGGMAKIAINGTVLAEGASAPPELRFCVTELLRPGNEIVVDVEFDPTTAGNQPGGVFGTVSIEIFAVG